MKNFFKMTCLSFLFLSPSLYARKKMNYAEKLYQTDKLQNGLELVLVESHKVPLITMVLVAKAGAMTETQDINGLTHLWEHMFFKGNARLKNQEAFNDRIRELGIVYNGDTSAETVRYYFTLPSIYLEEGLQFMSDAIMTPLLEQAELEKERKVVLDEYDRAASSPLFDLYNLERALVYGPKRFARDPLGDRKTIETATREQLLRIKKEVFVPQNCALVVGGDFDPKKIKGQIEKFFASWHADKDWRAVTTPKFDPLSKTTEVVAAKPLVENAQLMITFNGPRARFDVKDSLAADILISLLDQRSGKFYKKFEDSGLTSGAGLAYYTQSQAGEVKLYARSEPDRVKKIEKMLLDEIQEWLKPNYFKEQHLTDVRRALVINHKRMVNKTSEYTKDLAFWWSVTGLDYYHDYLPNLQKVTFDDVRNFIKKYLVNKSHITSIAMSPENAKKVNLQDNTKTIYEELEKKVGAIKRTNTSANQ